jgi:hypothetical protein
MNSYRKLKMEGRCSRCLQCGANGTQEAVT